MSGEKLPEWPKRPVLKQPVTQLDVASAWHMFEHKRAEAALARMEALVERVRHEPNCPVARMRGVVMPRPECSCGLDALLAACERNEAGR